MLDVSTPFISRLTLAEKMQLFQQKQDARGASGDAAGKREAPVTRRRKQRLQSRFRTQVSAEI